MHREAGERASPVASGLIDPMAADQLLSVAEAARAVGRSRQALYAHIAAGRLPATREGGRLRLSRRDLFAFFAQLPPPSSPARSAPVSDEDADADVVTVAEACSYPEACARVSSMAWWRKAGCGPANVDNRCRSRFARSPRSSNRAASHPARFGTFTRSLGPSPRGAAVENGPRACSA